MIFILQEEENTHFPIQSVVIASSLLRGAREEISEVQTGVSAFYVTVLCIAKGQISYEGEKKGPVVDISKKILSILERSTTSEVCHEVRIGRQTRLVIRAVVVHLGKNPV